MSYYNRRKSRYDSYWPAYVPVAERIASYKVIAEKLRKKGFDLHPVVISGKAIATTFWGKAWCDNVESYQDFSNRLPRGRSYVRNGAVLDLQISPGKVTAIVGGSSGKPYNITIQIDPLSKERWEALKKRCLGKISSLLDLLQGRLSKEVLEEFCNKETGLFPTPAEMHKNCSCPDWADLCKHLAAVLYAIGARLDEEPKLFFTLRQIDENELLSVDIAEQLTVPSEETTLNGAELSDIFGVDFDTEADAPVPLPQTSPSPKQIDQPSAPKPSSNGSWDGSQIKELRTALHWTQKQLAEKLGLPYTAYVSFWETGRHDVETKYHKALLQLKKSLDSPPPKTTSKKPKDSLPGITPSDSKKQTSRRKPWNGPRLKRERTKRGWTCAKVARALGVSAPSIANWESKPDLIREKYQTAIDKLFDLMP